MGKLIMSYCNRPGGEVVKGLTFGEMLERTAARFPSNVAVWYGERKYTYKELNELTTLMASRLLEMGFRRGDRVALLFPDWPEFTMAVYACAKIGVIVSPMNPLFREMELTTLLKHLEARAIFVPDEWRGFSFVQLLDKIRDAIPSLEFVFVKGENKKPWMQDFESLTELGDFSKASGMISEYLEKDPLEADDMLEIAYTSGTTGVPKGVVHTHNTRLIHSIGLAKRMGATSDDRWLCMTPLFHTTGNCVVQHTALLTGGALLLIGRYSADAALKELERCGATIVVGVPTMFIDLMNHPEFDKVDTSSVRYALFTGAPMPPKVALQIVERFKCKILQGDGTTECGSNVLSLPTSPVSVIAESPGPPLDVGNEVKVVDPRTGRIVPVNQVGEICHRGPTNFIGYYKNPEKTAEAVDSLGWFHSGDLGTMDEDGNIRLKGRIKDVIIRGGENIYAVDMEEVLYTYPSIKECQVIGYPDERLGEKTVACIIPKTPGTVVTREEIAEFLRDRTVKYLIPDLVITMDDFPRTASGKVQKYKLREMVAGILRGQ
jgi:acyl-CoA synthetase (AMP-forming)/AMP-acid ligase II